MESPSPLVPSPRRAPEEDEEDEFDAILAGDLRTSFEDDDQGVSDDGQRVSDEMYAALKGFLMSKGRRERRKLTSHACRSFLRESFGEAEVAKRKGAIKAWKGDMQVLFGDQKRVRETEKKKEVVKEMGYLPRIGFVFTPRWTPEDISEAGQALLGTPSVQMG